MGLGGVLSRWIATEARTCGPAHPPYGVGKWHAASFPPNSMRPPTPTRCLDSRER
jgi:hypothetical protein